jgi:hypothetical protein
MSSMNGCCLPFIELQPFSELTDCHTAMAASISLATFEQQHSPHPAPTPLYLDCGTFRPARSSRLHSRPRPPNTHTLDPHPHTLTQPVALLSLQNPQPAATPLQALQAPWQATTCRCQRACPGTC